MNNNSNLYSYNPFWIIGFHGCDEEVANKVISGKEHLIKSTNEYDWLGNGIYFWENSPKRAYEWACSVKDNPKLSSHLIEIPAVVGSIIDPGYCLNLLERNSLLFLKDAYGILKESCQKTDKIMPQNLTIHGEILKRNLDCAVIETLHETNRIIGNKEYDSVRGVFIEGNSLYPGGGIKENNHIQICVRNINCIKGYFRPLAESKELTIPGSK